MPKGYIIGHVTVADAEAYREYVERNTPILKSRGARYLVRGGACETVEGSSGERHVVIEFDDYETARSSYFDPEYQVVADIRRRTADSTIILVEGAE
ncbi:MAG: DUF1330 domain-containing protein [Pseudoprimorskyibacter sp.]|nr:DUF1330 domain-containing protein [Pseudoprimorskyibacter sp.]